MGARVGERGEQADYGPGVVDERTPAGIILDLNDTRKPQSLPGAERIVNI